MGIVAPLAMESSEAGAPEDIVAGGEKKRREVLGVLCVCKGHNLSAHGSVHREGALQIDRLKGESR